MRDQGEAEEQEEEEEEEGAEDFDLTVPFARPSKLALGLVHFDLMHLFAVLMVTVFPWLNLSCGLLW